MKAITVTETNKLNNPLIFKNYEVGSIAVIAIPEVYKAGGRVYTTFHRKTDLHLLHGFKDILNPIYDKLTHKLGGLEENDDNFSYKKILLTQEEIDRATENRNSSIPLLLEQEASEIGMNYSRGIDIPIDHVETLMPSEKIYSLKGEPLYKEYLKEDVCYCRIEYSKIYEDRTFEGVTSNELVGCKKKFIFYKDPERENFEVKERVSKMFSLQPTLNEETGEVVWSSSDREALLRTERYQAESVMKAFNPVIYNLSVDLWGDEYRRYQDTGNNEQLIADISTYELAKLDEQALDEDKAVVFGQEMETYPSLTIRDLIIAAVS